MIYLDHNASAPLLPEVRAALVEALALDGNPSSPHRAGREAAMALDRARAQVGRLCGRDPREVVFTSGATEANALALAGLTSEARPEVWVSAVEHPSALAWGARRLPVDGRGLLDLERLAALLEAHGQRVAVLSVQAANNETGVLQPVAAITRLARAHGVITHCDAAQIPGRLPLAIDADLITLSAHKMGGPKGVGALIGRPTPRPLLRGGPQERGIRPGTPALPSIVGFGVAAELAHVRPPLGPEARDRLQARVRALGARVLGEGAPRLPNTLSALFEVPGDVLVAALDLAGVAASTGSACASGASEPSHVVEAMGLQGVPVRFSLGPDSMQDHEVAVVAQALERAIHLWS